MGHFSVPVGHGSHPGCAVVNARGVVIRVDDDCERQAFDDDDRGEDRQGRNEDRRDNDNDNDQGQNTNED